MGMSQEQITAMHAAKMAQLNAFGTQLERKQLGSLNRASPPLHHHFMDQMHHQYKQKDFGEDKVLNLGKEREIQREKSLSRDLELEKEFEKSDQNRNTRKIDNEAANYDKRNNEIRNEKEKLHGDSSGRSEEDEDYSDDEMQKECE